ncbi:hypothetical protein TRICI_003890 [Trichomonascus ciferrii]|uniref:F-box domain-containing protein n=1 Tax=Trichomonascus ciferrii TaxID=44093 RepID=A0A642V7L1_9ASCO|nr:hypothetical protein TRICI_003890 [Trichomonascus ciferrii]
MALVFDHVYVSWSQLDKFVHEIAHDDGDQIASCVNALHITNSSSWGEWHKDKALGDLISICPNLHMLYLNMSGSSSWLKYIPESTKVKYLSATSQVAVDWALKTQDKNQEPSLPEFDLFDLQKLPNIKHLELYGFHVSDFSTIDSYTPFRYGFQKMCLKNCIWSFPFDFKDVNCSLTHLTATYTPEFQGFTYSERLKSLFRSPPAGLKQFSLHFPPGSHKSWCWDVKGKSLNQLTHLSLTGFQIPNDDFFKYIPSTLKQLDMRVTPTIKQSPEDIKSISKQIITKHQSDTLSINIDIY